MRLHVEKIRGWVTPADAFIALYSEAENSFWLDREHNGDGRFSVIGSGVPVLVESIADLGSQLDEYCLLYTSPSPRDYAASRMPSSA